MIKLQELSILEQFLISIIALNSRFKEIIIFDDEHIHILDTPSAIVQLVLNKNFAIALNSIDLLRLVFFLTKQPLEELEECKKLIIKLSETSN